jgi:hypothetical protein
MGVAVGTVRGTSGRGGFVQAGASDTRMSQVLIRIIVRENDTSQGGLP